MIRRMLTALRVLLALFLLGFFFVLPAQVEQRFNKVRKGARIPVTQKARDLHATLLIADLHTDSLLWDRNLLKRSSRGHVDLPRLREGNVAIQGFGIVTKSPYGQNIHKNSDGFDQVTPLIISGRWSPDTWTSLRQRAIYQARKLEGLQDDSGGGLIVLRSSSDVRDFIAKRRTAGTPPPVGTFLGLEGAHALEGKVENLDRLFDAGVRLIGMAHFFDNEFSGSAHGVSKGGLTPQGRELVRRMDEKRMIIDLAHASPQAIREILALTRRPVVVSHTGVRGTCDNQRNLSDEQIRGIAAGGGLIGIGYWETAVCGKDARAVARAIRHVVRVAGIDHVAQGSDFDGAIMASFDVSELVQVTQALLDEGFTEPEIRKIMGENLVTFLERNLP